MKTQTFRLFAGPIGATARLCAAVVVATIAIVGLPAAAQSSGSQVSAYDIALKCFVVDGYASRNSQKAQDSAKADYYSEKSENAFNVAIGLGKALGYSKDRVDADIDATMKRELPQLITASYYEHAASECRAYQLM